MSMQHTAPAALVLLNLDTTVNSMILAQGSETKFNCTPGDAGCTTINNLQNEGGSVITFGKDADRKEILQAAIKGDESYTNNLGHGVAAIFRMDGGKWVKLKKGAEDDKKQLGCYNGNIISCVQYEWSKKAGKQLVLLI